VPIYNSGMMLIYEKGKTYTLVDITIELSEEEYTQLS
jgi:hypothetical protein